MSAERASEDLLIVRTFEAPAPLVFSLWSEARHMRRWMGPQGYDCPELEMDFRVGGAWRGMIRSPAGAENPFGGTYREIEPHRRLVFTFTWRNDGPSAGIETLITLTFEARDDRTVQTFHQTPFLSAERRDSQGRGWGQTIDKAQAYAALIAKETGT
jgi:uncharacterized protein YndB with AHSA1/START domain